MKFFNSIALLLVLLATYSITSCSEEPRSKRTNKLDSISEVNDEGIQPEFQGINEINFYFENSASMNGYLTGKNFKQTMHIILGNITKDKLVSYFVNTDEYKVDNILRRIDSKKIGVGNISNSDHQFIFTNAIQNAINDDLSIVVTDGIYSVTDGDIDIVEIDIKNAFRDALLENEIETVILKLSSNFDGTYYSESCKPGHKAIRINQTRPYYVLLFGSNEVINKALNEIVETDELPGFEEKARFIITKDKKVEYTILTRGEEKHGEFMPTERGGNKIVTSIKDVKKYSKGTFSSTPKEKNYLSFGIAVDYSKFQIPNSYLLDTENYKVDDNTGYKITEVKKITELKKNTKTYKFLDRLAQKYTHIITVKANKNLMGELEIDLDNNLPTWIKNTGIENDCEINGNETQTFAFDQLINGISKAYEKVNNNDEYLEIKIKIKP